MVKKKKETQLKMNKSIRKLIEMVNGELETKK